MRLLAFILSYFGMDQCSQTENIVSGTLTAFSQMIKCLSLGHSGIRLYAVSRFPINALDKRNAEVLNSPIMKITAKENDTNDILQTFR